MHTPNLQLIEAVRQRYKMAAKRPSSTDGDPLTDFLRGWADRCLGVTVDPWSLEQLDRHISSLTRRPTTRRRPAA